jgi:hypothetical protein
MVPALLSRFKTQGGSAPFVAPHAILTNPTAWRNKKGRASARPSLSVLLLSFPMPEA